MVSKKRVAEGLNQTGIPQAINKFLFIACVNYDDINSGITRKVKSQFRSLVAGNEGYLICYYGNGIVIVDSKQKEKIIPNTSLFHRRLFLISRVLEFVSEKNITKFYIRRMPCNPWVLNLVKKLSNGGRSKILWEIPTYPYDFEPCTGIKAKITFVLDKYSRKFLKKYVGKIVTFSNVEEIFGIPTIRTGNGIEVDAITQRNPKEVPENEIHLIGVAVLNPWHGYDRLIEGLRLYYINGGKREVFFHIVGKGPCYPEYFETVELNNLNQRVIMHGYQSGADLDALYNNGNIAVESLGWHRLHVEAGTSLKSREYLAKGLPILASTKMDIFPDGWEYAFYAPCDDSPINISDIIKFYDNKVREKEPCELNDTIRTLAYEKCDMKNMMKPVLEFLT